MKILLVQLPIPKLNLGLQTGNVPLGAACLKIAANDEFQADIDIVPESIISYLSDESALDFILSYNPDFVSFSLFCWNVDRSLYFAKRLKNKGINVFLGGPEATKDNEKVLNSCADFVVFGEGESFFNQFVNPGKKIKHEEQENCRLFKELSSPYVKDLLEPKIQDSMLVETQRGCPYSCGYCYYNKSRSKICVKPAELVYEAVNYAIDKNISEVYFLDPSLNTRPDLKSFLNNLISINQNEKIAFHSEIRAEAITEELADFFAKAGFRSFEIGLQSVNPMALSVMKRPTNIEKFLNGVRLLKERDISPCIDLITGLPGDDPNGIKRSVDFICEHSLQEDVQFFPLSVIPGTDFRQNSKELGLIYNPEPPYNIISTASFSNDDILMSFDYAEQRLGISFFPMPDIDLSHKKDSDLKYRDIKVEIGTKEYISKLVIFEKRNLEEIAEAAFILTQPYQICFGPDISDLDYINKVLEIVSLQNPYTPFEVIFFDPKFTPNSKALLSSCKLKRPHFLDGDSRYLYQKEGNRAVLFTIAVSKGSRDFCGDMEREVFWWKNSFLPDSQTLYSLENYDGILIDSKVSSKEIELWQDEMYEDSQDYLYVTFSNVQDQVRWLSLTSPDTYYIDFFKY